MKNKGSMNIYILIAYIVIVILMMAMTSYAFLTFTCDIYEDREAQATKPVDEYQHIWVEDESLPCGGKDQISLDIRNVGRIPVNISFYAIHQIVKVYIDGQLIYSVEPSADNTFGKTPGSLLVSVPVLEEDCGETLTIDLIPVYNSSIGYVPTFYLGDKWDMYLYILRGEAWSIFCSIVSLVLGIIFCSWHLVNHKFDLTDNSLLHLGAFSMCIGVWKLSDLHSTTIFFGNSIAMSLLPLMALLLVIVPVLCFLRDFFKQEGRWSYNILSIVSLTLCYVAFVLQITGFADLRQMLIFVHILFGLMMATGGIHMFIKVIKGAYNTSLGIAIGCLIICLFGIGIDLYLYYSKKGSVNSAYGMIGFLLYVVVMGFFKIRESKKLMEQGQLAKHYQNIAYHDPLTGTYSRAAYVEYVDKDNFNLQKAAVVMFDLNDLKKCNDNLGHEKGDAYIKESVQIIEKAFGELGSLFRMGGDEFSVVLNDVPDLQAVRAQANLRKYEKEYNKTHDKEYPIHIACGYARYDKDEDYDLSDTVRRADKLMYRNKMEIKQQYK